MKISLLAFSLLCAAPVVAAPVIVDARAPQGTTAPGFSSARAQQIVGVQSRAVVRALQNNDTRGFAQFVHPTKGVRFSPYVHTEASDRVITRSQMIHLASHPRKWNWGTNDGEGGAMMLTWNDFRQKRLVPRPYLPVENTSAREDFNRLSQNGNIPNNLLDVYPGAIFTRYYLAGDNPNYGGLDWRALFLAWRPVGAKWYLVGVANDEWTT